MGVKRIFAGDEGENIIYHSSISKSDMSSLSSTRGWNQGLRRRRFRKTQVAVIFIFCAFVGIMMGHLLYPLLPKGLIYLLGLISGVLIANLILKIYSRLIVGDPALKKITWESTTWRILMSIEGGSTGLGATVVGFYVIPLS
ncbi:MAG: hypothetical protein ACOCTK_02010 [Candidatus Saliniplasma sp.]